MSTWARAFVRLRAAPGPAPTPPRLGAPGPARLQTGASKSAGPSSPALALSRFRLLPGASLRICPPPAPPRGGGSLRSVVAPGSFCRAGEKRPGVKGGLFFPGPAKPAPGVGVGKGLGGGGCQFFDSRAGGVPRLARAPSTPRPGPGVNFPTRNRGPEKRGSPQTRILFDP
jgi:hypothetical protein